VEDPIMALSWAYFALALIWFLATVNALRPPKVRFTEVGSFFAGWFVSELPLVHLFLQAVAAGLLLWAGAFERWPGRVAVILSLASWAGLVVLEVSSHRSWRHVSEALLEVTGQKPPRPSVSWVERRLPVPVAGRSVVRRRDIDYWGDRIRAHRLDLYLPASGATGSPMMIYVHGGAWILGDKREQGRPMLHYLARNGWVCASVNYRLSPRADWPEAVFDVKRALAWFKDHAGELGGDPDRMVISGGSAGGHLAALVALTADDRSLQPGFEDADTSVMACVPFYGVYDFTNSAGSFDPFFVRFLEKTVMKQPLSNNRPAFEAASPLFRLHPNAPPLLVVAGRNDTLVPVAEARRFVAEARRISHQPVCYVELPFAQHAFEIFPSVRSSYAIRAVEHFVSFVEKTKAGSLTPSREGSAETA
jgi:acetyl esterase/lipase